MTPRQNRARQARLSDRERRARRGALLGVGLSVLAFVLVVVVGLGVTYLFVRGLW